MSRQDKPLVWLKGEIRTPPLGEGARREAGYLLRELQRGERLSMPFSRPMPEIGHHVYELRIKDGDTAWRIIYLVDEDAIVILEVFKKKSQKTPKFVIENCRRRLTEYNTTIRE